jgi:hypothetical protein
MAKRDKSIRAIPLKEAWWHFAPRRLKDELDRFEPKRSTAVSDDQVENFKNVVHDLFEELFVTKPPIRKMLNYLLQRLCSAKFEAWGVMTKPEGGREPQRIPSYVFKGEPKINWARSTVENLGMRFEIVEVVRPTQAQTAPHLPITRDKAGRGRPRVGAKIEQVVRELRRQGSFHEKSEKQRVALVQERCRHVYPRAFPRPSQPSPTKIREVLKREDI